MVRKQRGNYEKERERESERENARERGGRVKRKRE